MAWGIRTDEGILGNDFAIRHELAVRPHKGVVYLSRTSHPPNEVLGECLECLVPTITGVRAMTEETLAVRMMTVATLLPNILCQVEVSIPVS